MTNESEVIHVDPGSELDRLLDEADDGPVILKRRGRRYRLVSESLKIADPDNIWADYDPEKALAATRAAAGKWKDVDGEALKEFIYRAREEGTRSPDRQ